MPIKKTLKPSEVKVWEKYYPDDAKNFDFPRMKAFDLVYEENRNRKDNIALEYEGNKIRYGEFFDKVEEKTEFFKSKGIKENDVVTVSMLMTPEFIYDWYSLGRLNAISNLIDPRTSVEGIKKYLKEAESRNILNTNIFLPKIMKAINADFYNVINYSLNDSAIKMPFSLGIISKIMEMYSLYAARKDLRIENYKNVNINAYANVPEYKENQPLTIVHTGGTTGFPKGVVLSHDNYNAMAYEYMKSKIGFEANDRFLLIMPPWISYGSGMLHMSLVTGMKATIISKLESKKMPEYLINHKPQWFAGVPAHYRKIASSDLLLKKGLHFLKAGAVGGDAMDAELYNVVNDYLLKCGAQKGVFPGYALTEVTSAFAVKQLGEYKPGSVGIPLPGGTVGIFKFDEVTEQTLDEELDYNKIGEICVRTPNQMLGYFKNDDLTNTVIKKHNDGNLWVHTGDLGHLDEDGFIYVDGRIKEMITRHDGFKIYPSLIEKVINTSKEVLACKVVGIDDIKNGQGQIPKAFIVLKESCLNSANTIIKNIKNKCSYCLPEYYVEGCEYETIESLPLTSIGKIDFKRLQQISKKQKTLKK